MTKENTKILIIEDDVAINNMYRQKFEMSGYKVHQAFDGDSGLIHVKVFKPHVLLLDLKLPGPNGDEVLKQIRESDWGAEIVVFILTNFSKDEAPSTLRFLNVEHYFVKASYTPAQILERIEETLQKYKLA